MDRRNLAIVVSGVLQGAPRSVENPDFLQVTFTQPMIGLQELLLLIPIAVVLLAVILVPAFLGRHLALKRGRSGLSWFVLCTFWPMIIVLACLPDIEGGAVRDRSTAEEK